MDQLTLDLALPPLPTFDNFIIADNQEILTALQAEQGERFIYLWGEPGCGKTHLLWAWITHAEQQGYSTIYLDGQPIPELAREASFVAVDHIDRLNEEDQIALFSTYNALRDRNQGRLLMAGRQPPSQLAVREDLRSRLAWGLVLEVRSLPDSDKATVLHHYAASRQLAIHDDVLHYLLTHGKRDLHSLLHMIDRLDQQSLALQRPITIPLLKTLLLAD